MLTEADNDQLNTLIKLHPELETIIGKMVEENKQITSMFVHELRNPLSLLKSTIQYIETKHPEAKDYKYWDQLPDLIFDLEHMMADVSLLNVCNLLNKEPIDLTNLIKSVVNSFMPQAITNQIDLSLDIVPGCENNFKSYCCDGMKMKQVISNLIKNAFEATSAGNFISVKLDCKLDSDQIPKKLTIQISNNGIPIPDYDLDTIFLPFVTHKKNGTGVGLAIVNKVIHLHYGSINVISDPSLTSFVITLPL